MIHFLLCFLSSALLASVAFATSPLDGRWRYDKTRSTALDGWHEWDLVIGVTGNQVSLQHDMKWGKTTLSATNVIPLGQPSAVPNFFRVEQRHMALHPAKGATATVGASWLDAQRTLRVEGDLPIEISQGQATMRLYSEYRLLEG